MRRRAGFWNVVVVTAALAAACPAFAQPAESGDAAIARGREAIALFEGSRWSDALAAFQEAEALYHSPVFVLYTARSMVRLGRLIDARERYRTLVAETLPDDAPDVWKDAKASASTELAEVSSRIATLVIVVHGPAAVVKLDGVEVSASGAVDVDPGTHRVEARSGSQVDQKSVDVASGARDLRVELHVEAPLVPRRAPPPVIDPVVEAGHTGRIVGVVVASVGGAMVIAGAVTGGFALDEAARARSALPSSCTSTPACPASAQPQVDATFARTYQLAHATDALLVTGGVALVTGIVVAIVDPGSRSVRASAGGMLFAF